MPVDTSQHQIWPTIIGRYKAKLDLFIFLFYTAKERRGKTYGGILKDKINLKFCKIQETSELYRNVFYIVKLQVLSLGLGVDFTFTLDNNHNNNDNNNNDNDNNPHLNFFKGTVLGVKEQGLGIRDKG